MCRGSHKIIRGTPKVGEISKKGIKKSSRHAREEYVTGKIIIVMDVPRKRRPKRIESSTT